MTDLPPNGMTEEQLEYFSTQSARAVRKALRRYTASASVGFVMLAAGAGYAMYDAGKEAENARTAAMASKAAAREVRLDSAERREAIVRSGRAVAIDACNRAFLGRQQLREVLEAFKREIPQRVADGEMTPAEGRSMRKRLDDRLEKLPRLDCRSAGDIITDDPNKPIDLPRPRYPGDGL